jgi:cytochrome c-type biogenesis protein CcmH/NrfG
VSARALQRAALVAVAVAAIAWLALGYADALRIRSVQKIVANPHATPEQLESALADARGTRALDPGTGAEALSYVASLELRLGHSDAAVAALNDIVRREPDTAEAWFLLAKLTRTSDPARSAEARARLERLDPHSSPAQP